MKWVVLLLSIFAIFAVFINGGAPKMRRKSIRGDGSCLFSSFQYAIKRGVIEEDVNRRLRFLVTNEIDRHPELYTAEMLGAPVELYKKHILRQTTWGGGIELTIFSNYYKTEIGVCNERDGRMITIGDRNDNKDIDTIVFLVYNSRQNHYDAMYRDDYPSVGEFETIFRVDDYGTKAAARQFCEELSGRGGSSSNPGGSYSYPGSSGSTNPWNGPHGWDNPDPITYLTNICIKFK